MKKNNKLDAYSWLKQNNNYDLNKFIDFSRLKNVDLKNNHFWSVKQITFYYQKLFYLVNWFTFLIGILAVVLACSTIAEYVLKNNSVIFNLIICTAVFAALFCLIYFGSFFIVMQATKKQYMKQKRFLMYLNEQHICNLDTGDCPNLIKEIATNSDYNFLAYKDKKQTNSIFLYVLFMSDFLQQLINVK